VSPTTARSKNDGGKDHHQMAGLKNIIA